jgi:hypothetical protein
MDQDGVYDHSKGRPIVGDEPEPSLLRYDYRGPFASMQEGLMTRALYSVTMPPTLLQDIVRPPLPQVNLFPPRYGYRTRELGILDVMDVNEAFEEPNRVDYTRDPAGFEGTSRNTNGNMF